MVIVTRWTQDSAFRTAALEATTSKEPPPVLLPTPNFLLLRPGRNSATAAALFKTKQGQVPKKGLVPLAIFLSRRAIVYSREGGGDSRGRKRQRQRILELDTRGVGQGKVAGLFILCSFFLGLENCVLVFSSSSPHLRRLSDRVAPMRNLGGGQEVWPEDWLGLRPQRACKISLHENTLLSFTL